VVVVVEGMVLGLGLVVVMLLGFGKGIETVAELLLLLVAEEVAEEITALGVLDDVGSCC
jgi:hypothetical protein